METPGGSKAKAAGEIEPANVASSCLDSSPVQESPCSNFLNNLSPLELKKAGTVPQGFIGINSPPLVFTSPRITLPLDGHAPKRPQVRLLSIEELPRLSTSAKSRESNQMNPDTHLATSNEDFVLKELEEDHPPNSSICIDGFLVDPITSDCVNSSCSDNAPGKEVSSASPSDTTPMKTIPPYHQQHNDTDEHVAHDLEICVLLDKSQHVLNKTDIEEKRGNVLSDASADQHHDLVTQAPGGFNDETFNNDMNPFSGSYCVTDAYQDCDNTEGVSASYLASRPDSEVITTQRGMLRRCLFDEARPELSSSSSYSVSNMMSPGFLDTSEQIERRKSTRINLSSISSKNQVRGLSKHNEANDPPHISANFPLTAPRPLGIGLHLNSVVSGQRSGHTVTSSTDLTGHNLSVKLAKSMPSHIGHVLDSTKSQIGVMKVKSSPEGSINEIETNISHATAAVESPHSIGPQNSSISLDHSTGTSAKKKFSSESQDGIDQMSPRKRAKKEPITIAGDGCKRCNCKKSKCLKLYCDCFAAGLYCSEPCACLECFNKPEYQDKVTETRKQIESRNPSAFASKIIETADQVPENDEERENRLALSSARHKRGCNCKRSQCSKKYCECYQANVGCSDNCRCEDCKNVYGIKRGYVLSEPLSCRVNDKISGSEKIEAHPFNDGSLIRELHDPHSLPPLTPSFQFSDHGKGPPRSRFPLQRIPFSPDSDIMTLPSDESKPSGDADGKFSQINTETLEAGILKLVDGISPKRESLLNLSHLTPCLAHPVLPCASSSSKARNSTAVSSAASSSKGRSIPRRGSRIVLVSKSGEQSSSSGPTLQGRISPITPATNLSPSNLRAKNPISVSRLPEVLEDDTPEILKEATTPTKPVNVNSPSRKRVSPPHRQSGSSSSIALKSGRKFILKSVPSFPPLTPCAKLKLSKNSNATDLQDRKNE